MRSLARAVLANTEARRRTLVFLAALPLALALIVGVAIGAVAESAGAGLIAFAVSIPISIAGGMVAARALLGAADSVRRTHRAFWLEEKLEPLRLDVRADEPRRIDIVHPALDLKHFFGGFIAVFNLARRLAERGHRMRLITLEGTLPDDWRGRLAAYEGIAGGVDWLEVETASDRSREIAINPDDAVIATHFTAAHIAAAALEELRATRFLYLIQEYEPFIFPAGSAAAIARASYDLPHTALFSTHLLRDWFAGEGIGVFAGGAEEGERRSASFDNAITPVGPVGLDELSDRWPQRLLFYARPEEHASRNLFEIGSMALDAAVAAGRFQGWELSGIGTVELRDGTLELPRSRAALRLLPRTSQADYANVLRDHDVGLALMDTPHPSLVPIEMAAAGMPTVTTTFANKTPAALAAISSNLIAADPTPDAVATALARAEEAAADREARSLGSNVAWPRSWDDAFADAVIERAERLLGLRPE